MSLVKVFNYFCIFYICKIDRFLFILCYTICSRHDIAEILLKLVLNTNQSMSYTNALCH